MYSEIYPGVPQVLLHTPGVQDPSYRQGPAHESLDGHAHLGSVKLHPPFQLRPQGLLREGQHVAMETGRQRSIELEYTHDLQH